MGISAAIGAIADAIADSATAIGIGTAAADAGAAGAGTAALIGEGVTGAGIGAGLGAGEAAVTGGNIATGAEFGGITGGAVGAGGPLISEATGFGATASDALAGAAGGAAGGAATGQNPLLGAAEGGVSGAISGEINTPSDTSATTGPAGSPTVTPAPAGSAPGSPVGATIGAGDVVNAQGAQISAATGPSLDDTTNTVLGQPGTAGTGGTQIGSVTAPSTSVSTSAGGDPTSLGPVNSTATTPPPAAIAAQGPNLQGGGPDLSGGLAPQVPAAPPTGPQSDFLAGSPGGGGSPNIGQGPTVASAPSVTSPPPSSAPGFFTNLSEGNFGAAGTNLLNTVEKNPALALGGAFTGYEALQGPPKPTSAENALQGQGNTLNAAGNASLAQANAGTLTAPQSATIAQYVQGQQNQLFQQLASEGVQNPQQDSRFIQGMQTIQQQAIAQAQTYIQQNFSNAMSELGAGAGDLTNVANAELQADNSYTESITAALQAMGGMYTIGNLSKAVTQTGAAS